MKKTTLKKSLFTVMVLMASAVLGACGGGKGAESSAGNSSSETTAESVAETTGADETAAADRL